MPTNRTPREPGRRRGRITAEAIRLWNLIKGIEADALHKEWEADGGRRREWHDSRARLHVDVLGLTPWDIEAADARNPNPPHWARDRVDDYRRAHRLHEQLEAAAATAAGSE